MLVPLTLWHPNLPLDAPTTTRLTVSSSSECHKCSTTKKSGKPSCCARGGAWFKNCGDAGDKHFDHTWTEGIQVCKDFETSVSIKSASQVILRHAGDILYPPNTVQSRNATQQQTNIYRPGDIFDTSSSTDCEDCVALAELASMFCIWSIIVFCMNPLMCIQQYIPGNFFCVACLLLIRTLSLIETP